MFVSNCCKQSESFHLGGPYRALFIDAMSKKKMNEDIPLEAVLKYIKEDRDRYKAKLERLEPYTKELERTIAELKELLSAPDVHTAWQRIAELRRENINLRARKEKKDREYEALLLENNRLQQGYHDTDWYKKLHEENRRLRENQRKQKELNTRLMCEIHELKEKYGV